ncbi:hypothetical protein OPQ81_008071 [Rhizoctonia solani]|nr:hypothetical protein OPQ81_008071 [Rhizoctonia solani]
MIVIPEVIDNWGHKRRRGGREMKTAAFLRRIRGTAANFTATARYSQQRRANHSRSIRPSFFRVQPAQTPATTPHSSPLALSLSDEFNPPPTKIHRLPRPSWRRPPLAPPVPQGRPRATVPDRIVSVPTADSAGAVRAAAL